MILTEIVDKAYTKNDETVYALYVTEPFDSYYKNDAGTRSFENTKALSVYVGTYECAGLKLCMEIDISYDKAIITMCVLWCAWCESNARPTD